MSTNKKTKKSLIYNLTIEEIKCPYTLIEQFFDLEDLPSHLELLQHWKELVLTDAYYIPNNYQTNLIHQHYQIIKLLEAAWLLRKSHKMVWTSENNGILYTEPLVQQKREKSGHTLCYLTDEELVNPYNVFRYLFKTYDLSAYRLHFREWLNEALSGTASSLTYSEVISFYKNLQKLYQASWLIRQQEMSDY